MPLVTLEGGIKLHLDKTASPSRNGLVVLMLAVDRLVEVWRSHTPVYLTKFPRPLARPRNDGYGKGVANINDLYLIIAWELR